MKTTVRLIATVLLTTAASSAFAAWTLVQAGEDSLYIDKEGIWRSGSTVKMWSMYDQKQPSPSLNPPASSLPQTISSTVMLAEYDCAERRTRILQGVAYEGQMGEGRQAWAMNGAREWQYAKPGSADETRLKIACKK